MELVDAETYLYTRLTNNAVGVAARVYREKAPPGAAMPCVVFRHYASDDVRGIGTVRVMVSALYIVEAITTGESLAALNTIANSIDSLLNGPGGGAVLGSVREQPFTMTETAEGVTYQRLGGIYRIYAQ